MPRSPVPRKNARPRKLPKYDPGPPPDPLRSLTVVTAAQTDTHLGLGFEVMTSGALLLTGPDGDALALYAPTEWRVLLVRDPEEERGQPAAGGMPEQEEDDDQ